MEIFQYEFMRNAIVASILASIACGIIGCYVVVKRLVFIGGGISHSAFGGIGLGYFLRIDPNLTVLPFSLLCALGIGWLTKKTKIASDTTIGIFWAVGMAIGVILINLAPGYAPDLFSYLFGNILTVPVSDLWMMFGLNLVILTIVFLFHYYLLAISFDEEYAEASGLPVNLLYQVLLCLVALTIVVLIRVVGTILVMALLTIPASIAKQHVKRLVPMMIFSICLGFLITLTGLWLSYQLNLASGATIILFSALCFGLSSFLKVIQEKVRFYTFRK